MYLRTKANILYHLSVTVHMSIDYQLLTALSLLMGSVRDFFYHELFLVRYEVFIDHEMLHPHIWQCLLRSSTSLYVILAVTRYYCLYLLVSSF